MTPQQELERYIAALPGIMAAYDECWPENRLAQRGWEDPYYIDGVIPTRSRNRYRSPVPSMT